MEDGTPCTDINGECVCTEDHHVLLEGEGICFSNEHDSPFRYCKEIDSDFNCVECMENSNEEEYPRSAGLFVTEFDGEKVYRCEVPEYTQQNCSGF